MAQSNASENIFAVVRRFGVFSSVRIDREIGTSAIISPDCRHLVEAVFRVMSSVAAVKTVLCLIDEYHIPHVFTVPRKEAVDAILGVREVIPGTVFAPDSEGGTDNSRIPLPHMFREVLL